MKRMYPGIESNLEIFCYEEEGEQQINIHGDPAGLRSFAKLLISLAELDQDQLQGLPVGAKEHVHLDPDRQLSASSHRTIVGRLDAKGTGDFHDSFKKRKNNKTIPAT